MEDGMSTRVQDPGDGSAKVYPFPGVQIAEDGSVIEWVECLGCGEDLMKTAAGIDLCVFCEDEEESDE